MLQVESVIRCQSSYNGPITLQCCIPWCHAVSKPCTSLLNRYFWLLLLPLISGVHCKFLTQVKTVHNTNHTHQALSCSLSPGHFQCYPLRFATSSFIHNPTLPQHYYYSQPDPYHDPLSFLYSQEAEYPVQFGASC